jgi:hypothetical protein
MTSFQYSALPSDRQFRLLQIRHKEAISTAPDGSTTGLKLSLELQTFSLDQAPRYWTLSYTWGPPRCGPNNDEPDAVAQANIDIECNGARMEVGENLHDFLQTVRDRGLFVSSNSVPSALSGTTRVHPEPYSNSSPPEESVDWSEGHRAYLWVDALCINQEDLSERASQVRMMGDIYKLSGRVLVWLGRQSPPLESAWVFENFIPRLMQAAAGEQASQVRKGISRSTINFEDGKIAEVVGADICERWRAAYPGLFLYLARTRWFGRGWTVQEVLLKNMSDITMLCGDGALRFDYFMGLMTMLFLLVRLGSVFELQRTLSQIDPDGPGMWTKPPSPLDTLDTLRKVRRLMYDGAQAPGMTRWQRILKLVLDMGFNNFTDPRDRVYGCLGLMENIVPKADLESIFPDYNFSNAEVMTAFARLLYENIFELEYILCLAGWDSASLTGDMPTWVPDFGRRRRVDRANLIALGVKGGSSGGFNASGLFPLAKAHAQVDGKVLVVTGAHIDTVGEVTNPQKPRLFDAEWFVRYCNRGNVYQKTRQGLPETVLLTLSVNNNGLRRRQGQRSHPGDVAGHVASTAREWYLQVLAFKHSHGLVSDASLVELDKAASIYSDWLPTTAEVRTAAERVLDDDTALTALRENAWDHQVTSFIRDRRLFLTVGDLLCLGPKEAESSDEVWIVRGSRVPIVLRRVGDGLSYQLIGEVYVHGVMYGEALTGLSEQQFTDLKLL